jgi:hypothetical protein
MFVGDRGMVTSHNLALVREHGHRATGPWM